MWHRAGTLMISELWMKVFYYMGFTDWSRGTLKDYFTNSEVVFSFGVEKNENTNLALSARVM